MPITIAAQTGLFKLRGGRSASLVTVGATRSDGYIYPARRVGEAEPDHFWKNNGEYVSSYGSVEHAYDLVELVSATPIQQASFVGTPKL